MQILAIPNSIPHPHNPTKVSYNSSQNVMGIKDSHSRLRYTFHLNYLLLGTPLLSFTGCGVSQWDMKLNSHYPLLLGTGGVIDYTGGDSKSSSFVLPLFFSFQICLPA